MKTQHSTARSIRSLLLMLSAAILAPMLLVGGYIASEFATAERGRLETDAERGSREIQARIDRELIQAQAVLRTLASSDALFNDNLHRFYERARALRDPGTNFVLRDTTGQQLLNTRVPLGTPLPKSPVGSDRYVSSTDKPYVSGLFHGSVSNRSIIVVQVPIIREGRVVYLLDMSLEPERIRQLLTEPDLQPNQIAAVVDQNGVYIARSDRHDEYVGKHVPADFLENAKQPRGIWRGNNAEGVPFFAAYTQSELSGWIVTIGLPVSALEMPLRRTLLWMGAFGLLAIGVAAVAAGYFGRRIADSVGALNKIALDLANKPELPILNTPVREVNAVSVVLANAATERRTSEARFRSVFQQAAVGIKRIDLKTGRILEVNDRLCRMLGYAPEDLVGRTFNDITYPPDRPREHELLAKLIAGDISEYAIDKRYKTRSGGYIWVRLTSSLSDETVSEPYRIAIAEDISQRKAFENQLHFTMRELSHRTKNLLAVVQSMARQTARQSVDLSDFEVRFSARVQALARAHDLLVGQDWQGVALLELIESQLQPFGDVDARVDTDGPSVTLNPTAAQHIALALHELATNAAKYGALSNADGKITIRWALDPPGPSRSFQITWEETGGPPVRPPKQRGFGTFVVEKMAGSGLNGTTTLEFHPDGVRWRLDMVAQDMVHD